MEIRETDGFASNAEYNGTDTTHFDKDSTTKELGDIYLNNENLSIYPGKIQTFFAVVGAASVSSIYVGGLGVKNLLSHIADTVLFRAAEDCSPKPDFITNIGYFIPGINLMVRQSYEAQHGNP